MSAPEISVIVCTYNRAPLLRELLENLAQQAVPADRFEVIAVDNGSTDDTPTVLASAAKRMPNLHVIAESQQGLCRARNAGWRAASAPLLAFLDDDTSIDNDWLTSLLTAWARAGAKIAAIGGPVRPIWAGSPPRWITARSRRWLSLVEWSAEPRALEWYEWLPGANMSVMRESIARIGGFPESLDPIADRARYNGDTFALERIRERGLQLWFEPSVVVFHKIPQERMRPGWFLWRAFAQGRSDVQALRLRAGAPSVAPNGRSRPPREHWGVIDWGCAVAHHGGKWVERLAGNSKPAARVD